MKTIDYSYFIERYISGEMDQVEKVWFEKELRGNESLQKEVSLRRRVDNALVRHDLISLRNKLASIEKERKEKQVTTSGKKSAMIRFAAAITAFVVLGSLYLTFQGSGNPESLFRQNFSGFVYSTGLRSDGETGMNSHFQSAIEYYSDRKFTEASSGFLKCISINVKVKESLLLYGVSEMENGNFESARNALLKLVSQDNNMLLDHAQWNLALCQIRLGELNEASRYLEAIINSDRNIYRSKARKLLKQIN